MLNAIVIILHICGLIFFFGACVGMLRFPDFYSRMHAASKGDTLSSLCLLGGFALFTLNHIDSHSIILALKLVFIILFIFISSPTASHALSEAAFKTGATPWGFIDEDDEAQDEDIFNGEEG